MATLGQKPATQHVSTEKQTITGNGGTSYTLQQSVSQASDIEVFVNNTRQEPTVAYTASGTTLTMTGAVNASDSFYVIFQGKAIQTAGLPVDAAITASTITTSQTITSTGNITTSGTVNTPSINGGQIGGRRNIIINGAMRVAQRGTSSTNSNTYGTVDRLDSRINGQDNAVTQAQVDVSSGTTPYSLGFRKAFRYTNGNQSSGAGTTDYLFAFYKIEAQDIVNSGWDYTSSSSHITISFWVKASVSQNYYGYLRTPDGTGQKHSFETGTLTADTWTKVTKTFSGNSNITIDNDTGSGLVWYLAPFLGTDYTDNSASLTAWEAYSSGGTRTPDNTSTWWTTNGATLEFTGLQLEVGEQATPFEHRSYGEELSLCQRYYEILGSTAVTDYGFMYIGACWNSTQSRFGLQWNVTKRASPTVTDSGTFYVRDANGSSIAVTSRAYDQPSPWGASPYYTVAAGLSAGNAAQIWADDGQIKADAEL